LLKQADIVSSLNTKGTAEIEELFDSRVFLFPKSTILLKSLMSQVIESQLKGDSMLGIIREG
jgi:hypothetical protein